MSVAPGPSEAGLRLSYLESLAVSIAERFGVETSCQISLSEHMQEEVEAALSETTGVVMATSATRRPHGGHFGSVADHVIRHAQRPVTLIGPKAVSDFCSGRMDAESTEATSGGPTSIVLPVDGSPLAERALPVAGALAEVLDLPISVVTIVRAGPGRESAEAESAYVHRLANSLAAQGYTAHHEVLHDSNPTEHVINGVDDGLAIPVLASHGRTGMRRLVAGSVATQVVRFAAWPVVVVPPNA